jgi:hypothetical protein
MMKSDGFAAAILCLGVEFDELRLLAVGVHCLLLSVCCDVKVLRARLSASTL